jgi:hypothetical protein
VQGGNIQANRAPKTVPFSSENAVKVINIWVVMAGLVQLR